MSTTDAVQEMERLAVRGWRLLPCSVRGKTPLLKRWPTLASSDLATIQGWAAEHSECNWGVATGPESRVFVLDVDGESGRASLAALVAKHGLLPVTLASRTGREDGGEHRWFRCPQGQEIRSNAGKLGEGLDVRGAGGYVIVPPSIHESGRAYQWANPEHPTADAPKWFLDLLAGGTQTVHNPPRAHISIFFEGQRNDGLARLGGAMRRRGATQAEIERRLTAENQQRCRPPLPTDEVRKIAASVARYEPGGPDPLETAWKAVLDEPHPRGYGQFIALARTLQLARPGLSIALPLIRIGDHMRCDWTQVRRWRKRAVCEGWLRLTEHPIPHRKAGMYAFNEKSVPLRPTVPLSQMPH
ncbi:MAG: bifunctional DNA primase/polymerase [Acidobacteriaceae bacterium]